MNAALAKRAIRRGLGVVAPALWSMRRRPSLVILTYHRVLPRDHHDRLTEQPGMCVSPETLSMHMKVIKKHFRMMDLADWVRRCRSGLPLPDRACAITFDDGWRDNYEYAFPAIRREQVPVTIFLVSDFIGSTYQFWPNRLAALLHGGKYADFPVLLRDRLLSAGVDLGCVGSTVTPQELDMAICACKAIPDHEMQRLLDLVPGSVGRLPQRRTLLDLTEIAEMHSSGLVRFGSHGKRHVRLVQLLDPRLLASEIQESKAQLQRDLGQPINLFCYPNGDHCPEAVTHVRSCYSAAVSTRRGWNYAETNPWLMHRVSVHDDVAAGEQELLARLSAFV